jgi:hypothetical protein
VTIQLNETGCKTTTDRYRHVHKTSVLAPAPFPTAPLIRISVTVLVTQGRCAQIERRRMIWICISPWYLAYIVAESSAEAAVPLPKPL